jgi:hypothetical protein
MKTCREVTTLVASDEYTSASWRSRMGVRLHLLFCKHCSSYVSQIRAMGARTRAVFDGGTDDDEAVERLEDNILKRIPPSGDES